MKSTIGSAASVALAMSIAAPAMAAEKSSLGYILPKTVVKIEVRQTLISCPESADEAPEIETSWSIVPVAVADPQMRFEIDTSAGFLAKRTTALVLRADGTPETFNASASGQGAAVVTSVLKLGTTLLPFTGALSSPAPDGTPSRSVRLLCTADASGALASQARLGAEIGAIEDKVLLGTATAAERLLLERKRKKRLALRESLTLAGGGTIDPPAWDGVAESTLALEYYIEPLAYAEWFSNLASATLKNSDVPGRFGFHIAIDPADGAGLLRSGAPAQALAERTPGRVLYYRQPLPGKIVGVPCATPSDQGRCKPLERGDAVSEPVAAVFAQWAGVRSLPIGTGGLFGSREAKARFDPFGTPLELSYGSDSGAAGIATSLDAASGAAADLRDAKLAEIERAIALEEARQKLAKLRAPADD